MSVIAIPITVTVTLWNCDDIGREKRHEKSQDPHFVELFAVQACFVGFDEQTEGM